MDYKSFDKLSREDKVKLRDYLSLSLAKRTPGKDPVSDRLDSMLESWNSLRIKGNQSRFVLAPQARPKMMAGIRVIEEYETNQRVFTEKLIRGYENLNKVNALYYALLSSKLIDWNVPVSLQSMINNLDKIPSLIEEAFPGYGFNGVTPLVYLRLLGKDS